MIEKLLYRVDEVCTLTGLSRATLYRLMDEGVIRPVRIRRAVRIPADELRSFVEHLKGQGRPGDGGLT